MFEAMPDEIPNKLVTNILMTYISIGNETVNYNLLSFIESY